MRGGITYEWVFTAAQTNLALFTVTAPNVGSCTYVDVTCANSNSVDVAVRLGFASTALPAITNDSAAGIPGMVFSHGGIARGGGAVKANSGEAIATGAVGDDFLLTCTAPTGGSLRIIATILEFDPAQ
jgi:hypothetical protein